MWAVSINFRKCSSNSLNKDEDDFLALKAPVKYQTNLLVYLKTLKLAYSTVTKEDCFLFNKKWTTEQVENKLRITLGKPMEHLLDFANADCLGVRQWRLLEIRNKQLELTADTDPDGSTLWDHRGTPGKSWDSWSVILGVYICGLLSNHI